MPTDDSNLLFETDTEYGHYEVWDTIYGGRPARVLYSGQQRTAQSGVPHDDNPAMLFDYNQRLFEVAIGLQPHSLLLIGGGVYTLPMKMLKELPGLKIDVVEIDAGLDQIAEKYFDFVPNENIRIIHSDGRDYIEANKEQYDLLMVDAFMGPGTPDSLKSRSAVEAYRRNLKPQGVFARNIISAYRGDAAEALRQQIKEFDEVFGNAEIFPASYALPFGVPQNLLLIAQVPPLRRLNEYFRYRALDRL